MKRVDLSELLRGIGGRIVPPEEVEEQRKALFEKVFPGATYQKATTNDRFMSMKEIALKRLESMSGKGDADIDVDMDDSDGESVPAGRTIDSAAVSAAARAAELPEVSHEIDSSFEPLGPQSYSSFSHRRSAPFMAVCRAAFETISRDGSASGAASGAAPVDLAAAIGFVLFASNELDGFAASSGTKKDQLHEHLSTVYDSVLAVSSVGATFGILSPECMAPGLNASALREAARIMISDRLFCVAHSEKLRRAIVTTSRASVISSASPKVLSQLTASLPGIVRAGRAINSAKKCKIGANMHLATISESRSAAGSDVVVESAGTNVFGIASETDENMWGLAILIDDLIRAQELIRSRYYDFIATYFKMSPTEAMRRIGENITDVASYARFYNELCTSPKIDSSDADTTIFMFYIAHLCSKSVIPLIASINLAKAIAMYGGAANDREIGYVLSHLSSLSSAMRTIGAREISSKIRPPASEMKRSAFSSTSPGEWKSALSTILTARD
jgi:hypothetical protein